MGKSVTQSGDGLEDEEPEDVGLELLELAEEPDEEPDCVDEAPENMDGPIVGAVVVEGAVGVGGAVCALAVSGVEEESAEDVVAGVLVVAAEDAGCVLDDDAGEGVVADALASALVIVIAVSAVAFDDEPAPSEGDWPAELLLPD